MKKERVKWLGGRDAVCPQCGSRCIAEDYVLIIAWTSKGPIYSPITHTRYHCPKCGVYEL